MVYSVTLIEGDGIGPEVTEATRRVLEATGVSFRWDLAYAGQHVMDTFGTTLLDHVLSQVSDSYGVGPFVVVPGHHLGQVAGSHQGYSCQGDKVRPSVWLHFLTCGLFIWL